MAGAVILNQPGVYLVDADGNVVTVDDGDALTSVEGFVVAGKDGSTARFMRVAADGTLRIDPTGTTVQPISASTLPLPSGAATESTLAALNVNAQDIETILAAIRDTGGIKKITDPIVLGAGSSGIGKVKIEDGAGSGRVVAVDNANRLVVSANATIVPAASSPVSRQAVSALTGISDDVYPIPNGQTLTISRFAGGAEGNSGKVSKITLFYDPNGTGSGMVIIRLMYVTGNNWEFTLDYQQVGNGTRAIRMRRERLDGAADEVAAFWDGFTT